jgi:hypothetical protein
MSQGENITQKEKHWSMGCHLSAFLLILIPLPVPFLNVIGPLICYIIKGRRGDFVSVHARESLAFQLLIAVIMSLVLTYFIGFTPGGVGTPSRNLLVAISFIYGFQILFTLVATWKASQGRIFRFPVALRLFP